MQEYKKDNKFQKALVLIVVFFVGALSMYGLVRLYPTTINNNVIKTIKDVTVTDTGIADAVEKVYDAVVTVETYVSKRGSSSNQLYSTGTGFVYKDDGKIAYILTNNHVIEDGDEIHVVFTNGNAVKVDVVGSDAYADIAVLSVKSDEIISVAEIGSSVDLRVGDTVFAVGAPIDSSAYSWSVTRGIISGKDRLVEVSLQNSNDWIMSVLQTDTAINSGNSGGPLANSNGEVIGINSMKLASSNIEGMGFAIPIETAIEYAEKIMNNEEIKRPLLGVSTRNVSEVLSQISAAVNSGVYITDVISGSPASDAGLKVGDIIVKFNGDNVTSGAFLKYQLYKHEVGDKIVVSYYRGNELKETTINLTKSVD